MERMIAVFQVILLIDFLVFGIATVAEMDPKKQANFTLATIGTGALLTATAIFF